MMLVVAWLTMTIIEGRNLKHSGWRNWKRWRVIGLWCWMFWRTWCCGKQFPGVECGDQSSGWCQSELLVIYEFQRGTGLDSGSDISVSDGSRAKGLESSFICWSIHPRSAMIIGWSFSLILRICNLPKSFLAVIYWVSASILSLIAILMQWSKCHQQLKRSWLLPIRLIASMKMFCWSRSFSMLWSSYMLTGSVFRSQTFSHSHSLGFVVYVGYPWGGKSWSRLNSSSWCVRLTGGGIGRRLETQEYFDVMEAGEDPWINEGLMKGGWDLPLEVVVGIGLEIGVLMTIVWYSCW